ncbi:MAG TPA: hypothetical protein PKY56_10930 [Candidatus Kapabacteria bacterium]|nr:hypothetical protein [Candidatus Kapabacteria bacterium]
MKQYNSIITILLLCLLVSCSNTNNTSEQTIDPFSNGGSERNMIVVISDIHLGADLSYAE